jgi:cadmium resistance transport/sequestration family protein
MENLSLEIGIAITLFAGTNIDDIFVLLAFFSDKRFSTKQVILGQYLGIFALTMGSIGISYGAKQIPQAYIGLLGLVPLVLGLYKLWGLFQTSVGGDSDSDDIIAEGYLQKSAKFLTVAGVTMANGGDNVGVYVPLFATKTFGTLLIYLFVFFIMTGVWCAGALYLIHHKHIGGVIKRYCHYVVPWIFIVLGGYILYEAGSFNLLN